MFTGIIEEIGIVTKLETEGDNLNITVKADMAPELKIDQSVAHNGVCLTVVETTETSYRVTAVAETMNRTNLGQLREGDLVNLERGMLMNARLDGHIVQGHVDQTGRCIAVEPQDGSCLFRFQYDAAKHNVTIEKGSITINGVSLTVVDSAKDEFSVAIIPFTLAHTTFKDLKQGDTVNLEFDVIGKYVSRLLDMRTA